MSDYHIKFKDDSAGKAIDVCVTENGADYGSTRRFAKAYLDVLARTDISAMDKLILAVIGMLSQKTGMAYPSVRTIARMLGTSIYTIERHIAKLVERKELIKNYRYADSKVQLSNFYSLPAPGGEGEQSATPSKLQGEQNAPPIRQGEAIRQEGTPEKIKNTGTSLRSSPVGAKKTDEARPFLLESKNGIGRAHV